MAVTASVVMLHRLISEGVRVSILNSAGSFACRSARHGAKRRSLNLRVDRAQKPESNAVTHCYFFADVFDIMGTAQPLRWFDHL
jgi:hypothetical protein